MNIEENGLRGNYRKRMELCLILSLVLNTTAVRYASLETDGWALPERSFESIKFQLEDIALPRMSIVKKRMPPRKPTVPVPVEVLSAPGDMTIDPNTIDLANFRESTIFTDPEATFFLPHQSPPEPIGGLKAMLRNLVYPKEALRDRIEDKLVIQILVNKFGEMERLVILQEPDNQGYGFVDNAIWCLVWTKWEPATQHGNPVKCWLAVPFRFELR